MSFSSDAADVHKELRATAEMLAIVSAEGGEGFPIGNIHDCRHALMSIRIPGTFISESELPALRSSLGAMSEIAMFFARNRDDNGISVYPELDSIASDLSQFPEACAAIDRIIDRHGEIKDNASPELAEIRRSMTSTAGSINSAMKKVLAAAVREGFVESDTTPSVRDGRLVIPVPPMYKRKIPGIVHDESASGKTFYIEPAEIVEANNRLRELRIEERHEIIRILILLADSIRPCLNDILAGFELLGIFDFIHAKARFAQQTDATLPNLSDSPEIEWYHACHPVLRMSLERQGKSIVPLDITLSGKDRILVISGPNAGGKSVTLKTVGIIQYMTQCGLLPTVHENSHIGIMDSIFIDIGDDQSIEDDLSTYSSHLRNMKFFLSHGNQRTLILIDEFGGGTEPQIGGAIAQAMLRYFNDKKMWGIVTTHYHNLKQFAEDTEGLVNGSMLYDRNLMQPMFKLAIGHPGSSFAFEIARKTGLPECVIDDAREIVGSDYVNMDRYLLDIARDRRYWEKKRDAIRIKEKKIQEVLDRYESEAEALRGKRREIISEAREEARKILESSNASIERTIRDIREAQAEKERTREARRRLAEDRRRMAEENSGEEHPLLEKAARRKEKTSARKHAAAPPAPKAEERPLAVGDNVILEEGGTTVGTIAAIDGKNATVVFGQMKTSVKLAKLKRTIRKADSGVTKAASFISEQTADDNRRSQLNFKTEIDVRGMRVDEAVQAVMYFIDDAIRFNISRVRILHGTGTGALRQYIRNYLSTVGAVGTYHDEDVRFGGAGITIVELR